MDATSFVASDGDAGLESSRVIFDSAPVSGLGHASPERTMNAFVSAMPMHCSTCGGMGHQSAVCPSGAAF